VLLGLPGDGKVLRRGGGLESNCTVRGLRRSLGAGASGFVFQKIKVEKVWVTVVNCPACT